MRIIVSPQDATPLYMQIMEQIKQQIAAGSLTADTQLPSIRQLAKDLEVSVITTKRAYDELEKEGLIYSLPGRGNFIHAHSLQAKTEWRRLAFENRCEALIEEGRSLGLTTAEMKEMLMIYLEEDDNDSQ